MDSYKKIFENKQKVLLFTAHPDDAEINAGGLISRLVADGKEPRIVVVTNGINGNKTVLSYNKTKFSNIRIKSQIESANALGVLPRNIINLGIEDGYVENNIETIKAFVKQIREFKPDIVITHSPHDSIIKYKNGIYWANHRDHRNVAQNVIDAVYPYSRDANFFPDLIKEGANPHYVEEMLFFEQFDDVNEHLIDITEFLATKESALRKHMASRVLSDTDINVFINENRVKSRYYERFGYVIINRLNTIK